MLEKTVVNQVRNSNLIPMKITNVKVEIPSVIGKNFKEKNNTLIIKKEFEIKEEPTEI